MCGTPMATDAIFSPPSSRGLQRFQHFVCLGVGVYGAAHVISLSVYCGKLWRRGLLLNSLRNIFTLKSLLNTVFGAVTTLGLKDAVESVAFEDELKNLKQELLGDGDEDALFTIPLTGLSKSEILTKAEHWKGRAKIIAQDKSGEISGRKWGGIYHDEVGELTELQNEMWRLYNYSNTLYPTTFPGIRKFEAELVSMTADMVSEGMPEGEPKPVGLLSSGGTESILIAVLSYREWGRTKGIVNPEIVACESAHPALLKVSPFQ